MKKFNETLLKGILSFIEYKLEFSVNGISEPQCFDLKCNININDIHGWLNKNKEIYQWDDIKYCLAILYNYEYIHISNGVIDNITPKGLKFLLSTLYHLECKY